jgi:hypothetical protein
MTTQTEASFELVFKPSLTLVSVVRRFVQNFYEQTVGLDAGSQLALATHELLENAVKYSSDGETSLSIDVVRVEQRREVTIRTVNRARHQEIEVVEELLRELQRTDDAFQFYQQLMTKSARRSDVSRLGLARIVAEADMTLEHQRDGDRLTIQGRCITPVEVAS